MILLITSSPTFLLAILRHKIGKDRIVHAIVGAESTKITGSETDANIWESKSLNSNWATASLGWLRSQKTALTVQNEEWLIVKKVQ